MIRRDGAKEEENRLKHQKHLFYNIRYTVQANVHATTPTLRLQLVSAPQRLRHQSLHQRIKINKTWLHDHQLAAEHQHQLLVLWCWSGGLKPVRGGASAGSTEAFRGPSSLDGKPKGSTEEAKLHVFGERNLLWPQEPAAPLTPAGPSHLCEHECLTETW